MNPDKIESWQLVLPINSSSGEVGSIKISHKPATSTRENKFPFIETLSDGDMIILTDKKTQQTETLVVSISSDKQDLSVSLER